MGRREKRRKTRGKRNEIKAGRRREERMRQREDVGELIIKQIEKGVEERQRKTRERRRNERNADTRKKRKERRKRK